jgi:recombination protein RecT
MSPGTDIEQRTPAQELVASVRSEGFMEQIALALPETVSPAKFQRVAVTALMANPTLAEPQYRESVIRSLIQCAQIGLLPDGKEAALVPFKGTVSLIPMAYGFRQIAAEYGWQIRSAVVYQADEFEYDLVEAKLAHRAPRPGVTRGDKIAAWAKAVHRDGRTEIEVMDAAQITRVRNVSRAKSGPWFDFEDRMWEKSPVRRLFAKLGLAESDRRVFGLLHPEDLAEGDAQAQFYGAPSAETPDGLPATTDGAASGDTLPEAALSPTSDESLDEPPPEVEYATEAQRRLIFARARECGVEEAGLRAILDAFTGQVSSAKIPADKVDEILAAIGEPPTGEAA